MCIRDSDLPMPTDESGQVLGGGLFWGEAGDAVCDFLGGALAVQSADVATDTEDLGCVGKADLGLVAGGCDPGCPLLGASVAAVEGNVLGGEVAGRAGQH